MLFASTLSNCPKNLSQGKNRLSNNLPPPSSVLLDQAQLGHKFRNVATNSSKEEQIARLREMYFNRSVELSVSAYDTAWVSMVPLMDSPNQPQFPKCLNWLLENQQPDGSWALLHSHQSLIKDSLTSTLASVLALTKWNASYQAVTKGLDFVMSNIGAATDKHQHSPIGFDIIFPGMIKYARDMGLNLPLNQSLVDEMLLQPDLNINIQVETMQHAYVAEGLMESNHWKEVMKYQRSNGSLFNSPATTAAALIHFPDEKCLDYLNSILKKFDNAVPTIYPLDIYTRLSIVDNMKKLGVDRYFKEEIERVLDDVYRYVFSLSTEYDKDPKSVLELSKASQQTIFQNELVLENICAWTAIYLKEVLLCGVIQDKSLHAEVDYALKHSHSSLARIENRNYIENYNVDNIALVKTSYRFHNVDNRALLTFSSQDFNLCQSFLQKELDHLEGWVKKYRIDQLKFARQTTKYCYFSLASEFSHPDLSDARACWAQNGVLTIVVDDFFDFAGSMEELVNLIELFERWDDHLAIGFKSTDVEILFRAIYDTVYEFAAKARAQQGRCVKKHFIDIWIMTLKAMLTEAEWKQDQTVPTMYEYLSIAHVSAGLGPNLLMSIYFMRHTLSEEAIASTEYKNLFMHLSMIARLTNDRVTLQREVDQGKHNSLSLMLMHRGGSVTEENAREELSGLIGSHRKALLGMVVRNKGSLIPRACKDVFWSVSKLLHAFYESDDNLSSPGKMVHAVNSVVYEPIVLS